MTIRKYTTTIHHMKQTRSTFDSAPPPQDEVQWVQSVYFQWNSGRRLSVTLSSGTVYSSSTPGFSDWNSSWSDMASTRQHRACNSRQQQRKTVLYSLLNTSIVGVYKEKFKLCLNTLGKCRWCIIYYLGIAVTPFLICNKNVTVSEHLSLPWWQFSLPVSCVCRLVSK